MFRLLGGDGCFVKFAGMNIQTQTGVVWETIKSDSEHELEQNIPTSILVGLGAKKMFRQPSKLAIGVAVMAATAIYGTIEAPKAEAFIFNGDRIEVDAAQDLGKSFQVTFDGNVDRTAVEGLSSLAKFTLTSFANKQAIFNIELSNTSDNGLTSRTSALGFDIADATVTSASVVSGSLFTNAVLNDAFPNGFGKIEVCFINNANNCKGGGGTGNNSGVLTGQTGSFAAAITLSESAQKFAMSNFGVRYQSIDDGGELSGASGTGRGTTSPISIKPKQPTSIPEPATGTAILLTGVGLLSARRKKQSARF
ncbi:MAG: hypothetical protein Fur0025_47770 [Oscillatoriaceae cyanobacterium]